MAHQRDTRPAWVQRFEKNLETEFNHTTAMSVQRMEPDGEEVELVLEYGGGPNPESYEKSKERLCSVAKMAMAHEVQMLINGRVITPSGTLIMPFRVEPEWCHSDNSMDLPDEVLDEPTRDEIYSNILDTL